tara:strand:- start:921 stop:1226 length:306 start_codon:yes stop_codon:yes gene_type:complete
MYKNILIFFLSLFLYNVYPLETKASPQKIIKNVICKEKEVFKNFLKQNQDEQLIWFGLAEDGSTITELYESKNTKKWTIVETNTNGISCATIGGHESTFLK